jgi:hypothetical protein
MGAENPPEREFEMRVAIETPQAQQLIDTHAAKSGITHADAISMGVNYVEMKPSYFELLINFNAVYGTCDRKVKVA